MSPRWRRLLRPGNDPDQQTADEFAFHMAERIQELMAEGLDRETAERIAAERFGDRGRLAEACRQIDRRRHRGEHASAWLRDLHRAARTLLRQPGFTVPAAVVLATGLAVTFAVVALLRAYLFAPFPYPDADRLMQVRFAPQDLMERPNPPAVPDGLWSIDWPASDAIIEANAAWDLDGFTLVGPTTPEEVEGAWVSPGYFEALEPPMALGRPLAPEPEGGAREAVISHALWQRRYGGDPAALGSEIRAYSIDRPTEAETFTIVGVLGADYWHIDRFTDLLLQLRGPRLPSLIRVRPGVSAGQLADHLTAYARARLATDPRWRLDAEPAGTAYAAEVRPALFILGATAGLILLVVCGNLGTLLLACALARERIYALHSALGARASHLWRQVFAEGLVLSVVAGALALATAALLLHTVGPSVERNLGLGVPGGTDRLGVDGAVLLAAVTLTAVATGLFGTVPALIATRVDIVRLIGGSGASGHAGRRQRRLRQSLLAGEVALSFVLMVLAGLMFQSARHLGDLRFGFDTEVVHGRFMLRERSYPSPAEQRAFAQRLLERLSALPGIEAVALAEGHPMRRVVGSFLAIEGDQAPATLPRAVHHEVSPGYFTTLDIPVLVGRRFNASDGMGSTPVAMVSADLADRLWPGEYAIGKRLRRGLWTRMPPDSLEPWRTVVGVVADTRKHPTAARVPDTYVPLAQSPRRVLAVMVRAAGPVAAVTNRIEASLWELDPTIPLTDESRLAELIDRSLARPRFVAHLLSALAAFALLLSVFGMYAVVAYQAAQRQQEIAIRLALGARRGQVIGALVRETTRVAGAGVVLGTLLALWFARQLLAELHGVSAYDPLLYTGMAFLLGGAAAAAVVLPAHRAARVDPAGLLRGP